MCNCNHDQHAHALIQDSQLIKIRYTGETKVLFKGAITNTIYGYRLPNQVFYVLPEDAVVSPVVQILEE